MSETAVQRMIVMMKQDDRYIQGKNLQLNCFFLDQ